jgi:hypothetical protein
MCQSEGAPMTPAPAGRAAMTGPSRSNCCIVGASRRQGRGDGPGAVAGGGKLRKLLGLSGSYSAAGAAGRASCAYKAHPIIVRGGGHLPAPAPKEPMPGVRGGGHLPGVHWWGSGLVCVWGGGGEGEEEEEEAGHGNVYTKTNRHTLSTWLKIL